MKNQNQPESAVPRNSGSLTKFLIPSLFGAFLFLIPFPFGGSFTVFAGVVIDALKAAIGNAILIPACLVIIVLSAAGAVIYKFAVKEKKPGFAQKLFDTSTLYLIFRLVGAVLAIMTFFKLGPEFIWSGATGGTMLNDLMPTLLVNFSVCCFFLPFLLDFGSMDYVGILIRKVMRPLFTIPGRSSLDCLASFIGNGTVGVVITSTQYDEGYYTGREAAVIATCFSIVSIPFCLVIAKALTIDHYFFPMYLTLVIVCIILAIVTPRIYPLRRIADDYYAPVGKRIHEDIPSGISRHRWALEQGIARAAQAGSAGQVAKKGACSAVEVCLTLLPIVMFGGTLALVIAESTPFFDIIAYPFTLILQLLRIPEAAAAAPGVVAGFADMFLPAILGGGIQSEMTRFFVCVLSLCQLIFITENVMVLLKSNIPIAFGKLALVFLERTLIAMPIIALAAHLIF